MMLRQQSYAIKNQLVAKIPPTRDIFCSSLVLYSIRIVGFHARKGPIIGANENAGYISTEGGLGHRLQSQQSHPRPHWSLDTRMAGGQRQAGQ